MLPISKIFGIFNWCLIYVAIFLFLLIFLIIYKCRRELRNVSFLLQCNTSLSGLLTCLTVFLMTSSNLFNGFLIENLTFGCIWGLFYDIFECSIYHSYYLQSFYRLCRVVFYKKRFLQSYSLYIIFILIEWLLILIFLFPPYFLNWYSRLPTEYYCLIPYTAVGPEIYHIVVLYTIPLFSIIITYTCITIFIRNSSLRRTIQLGARQRQRNERDLVVIKRIIILISLLIVLRFPTIIFMIDGIIQGKLFSLTYSIVGLITTICLIIIAIITIYITPQFRTSLFQMINYQNNRIHIRQINQFEQGNITNLQINPQTTFNNTRNITNE